MPLPVVPGFERDGDWLVESKSKVELDRLRATPTPRPFGPLQQLRVDLSTRRSQILYAMTLGSLLIGLVTWDVVPAVIGAVLIVIFGQGFVSAIRLARHGVITIARIGAVDREMGTFAVNEDVNVDGRRMRLGYELAPVRAILASGRDVEMQVVYLPKARKPIAQAFAYRPLRNEGAEAREAPREL